MKATSLSIFDTRILEPLLSNDLETVYQGGKSEVKQYEFEKGKAEVLIEAIIPPQPLVIFGGGHDVYPVINLANQLGWHVTVVEYRESFSKKEKFPMADSVLLWDDS